MQIDAASLPMNALRAFDAAARRGSFKQAAEDLAVTPGAVSRQVKLLEERLGVALFRRRNNAVLLTGPGLALHRAVAPALDSIARAAEAVSRSAAEVVLTVAVSLAVRWLIPRLEGFQRRHPGIELRLSTAKDPRAEPAAEVDAVLLYARDGPPRSEAELVLRDLSQPVCSRATLEALERRCAVERPALWPIIGAAAGDWDWRRWAEAGGLDAEALGIAHRFDSDDAAIEAAIAGLGVTLASRLLIESELRTGQLVALPGSAPIALGGYWLLIPPRARRRSVERFRDWLLEAARAE